MMNNPFEDARSYENQPYIPYNTHYPIKSAFQYDDLCAPEDQNLVYNLASPEYSESADYPRPFEERDPVEQPVLPDNSDIDKFYVTNS